MPAGYLLNENKNFFVYVLRSKDINSSHIIEGIIIFFFLTKREEYLIFWLIG